MQVVKLHFSCWVLFQSVSVGAVLTLREKNLHLWQRGDCSRKLGRGVKKLIKSDY